mmetsp:Transcript_7141/g.27343  ORF Transcript_7141/g.27343 Transcript_7141/m.27343 type:complete len:214 (-) Transcript_7141:402-1043(-)
MSERRFLTRLSSSATFRRISMSSAAEPLAEGLCTLIATSAPFFKCARYTCPMEAAATGSGGHAGKSKTSLGSETPSSLAITSMATAVLKESTSSWSLVSSSTHSGTFTRSGRRLAACPPLMNVTLSVAMMALRSSSPRRLRSRAFSSSSRQCTVALSNCVVAYQPSSGSPALITRPTRRKKGSGALYLLWIAAASYLLILQSSFHRPGMSNRT